VPLRPNRVHPLWRTDHDNNVGIGAPEIEYGFEPEGAWIDLITVHKGGLFGTDYRMLFPSDGIQGIKRFYLDSLMAFGKRGLACQPAIIGIGLGGSKDICMTLGKRASTLRVVGSRNADPKIAEMEDEFKELGNSIGMGAMGFVGKNMVIDCNIEVGYYRRHANVGPCLLSQLTPRRGPHPRRWKGRIPYRPRLVHALSTPRNRRLAQYAGGSRMSPREVRLSTTPTHRVGKGVFASRRSPAHTLTHLGDTS